MAETKRSIPKIGAGHASAMFRTGLSELRNLVNYPEGSNIPVNHIEPGIVGTATAFDVNRERHDGALGLNRDSVLEERLSQAASRDEPNKDEREKGLERD